VPAKRVKRKKVASRRGKYDRSLSTTERRADQHAKLLDVATQVIASDGFSQTTVESIVAKAGMSRRTFYEHFDDVRDVLSNVYDRAAQISFTMVASRVRAEPDPLTGVRLGAATYFEAVATYPEVARVMFEEYRLAGPDYEARYQRDSLKYAELMFESLKAAFEKGQLTRLPTERVVYVFSKGIEALAMREIARGEQKKLPAMADEISELVISAFR